VKEPLDQELAAEMRRAYDELEGPEHDAEPSLAAQAEVLDDD